MQRDTPTSTKGLDVFFANKMSQFRHAGQCLFQLRPIFKSAHRLEWRDCQCHFWLVVVVFVHIWPLLMKLLCQRLIGMGLDRKSCTNGEDFEQVGKSRVPFGRDFISESFWILFEPVGQQHQTSIAALDLPIHHPKQIQYSRRHVLLLALQALHRRSRSIGRFPHHLFAQCIHTYIPWLAQKDESQSKALRMAWPGRFGRLHSAHAFQQRCTHRLHSYPTHTAGQLRSETAYWLRANAGKGASQGRI